MLEGNLLLLNRAGLKVFPQPWRLFVLSDMTQGSEPLAGVKIEEWS